MSFRFKRFAILAVSCGLCGCAEENKDFSAWSKPESPKFEIRGAEEKDTGSLTPVSAPDSKSGTYIIWLQPTPLVTTNDIKSARVIDSNGQLSGLEIVLAPSASVRFAQYTKAHIGSKVAFCWDGRVITDPVIHSEIKETMVITRGSGNISGFREMADEINKAAKR